jgi:hypothetical protein
VSVLLNPLQAILCVLQNIAMSMLSIGVMLVNALIGSIGGFMDVLGLLLPNLPAPVGPPGASVVQWLLWVYPLGAAVGIVSAILTAWLAFLAIRVGLRWVRML